MRAHVQQSPTAERIAMLQDRSHGYRHILASLREPTTAAATYLCQCTTTTSTMSRTSTLPDPQRRSLSLASTASFREYNCLHHHLQPCRPLRYADCLHLSGHQSQSPCRHGRRRHCQREQRDSSGETRVYASTTLAIRSAIVCPTDATPSSHFPLGAVAAAVDPASVGNRLGTDSSHPESVTNIGMVLRRPVVARQFGLTPGHNARDISRSGQFGSPLSVLVECTDGSRTDERASPLRVRSVSIRCGTEIGTDDAGVRLRGEIGRTLYSSDERQRLYEREHVEEGPGVGRRSWPHVLAHLVDECAVQTGKVANVAASGEIGDQRSDCQEVVAGHQPTSHTGNTQEIPHGVSTCALTTFGEQDRNKRRIVLKNTSYGECGKSKSAWQEIILKSFNDVVLI